jgi:uncharacterized protein YegJ (DUF2314 family)
MQRHAIAATLPLLATLACTQSVTEREWNAEMARMQSEETALRQAEEMAQATLDGFLTQAKRQPAGTSAYALRVKLQEGRDTEYFWVEEFTWSDGLLTGRINNEPTLLKRIKPGQTVKFGRSQVADWKYRDEATGKTRGNFTACALLRKEPPAQAEEIKRRDGLDCR